VYGIRGGWLSDLPSVPNVGRSEDGDDGSELREAALAADGAVHRFNEVSHT
jgi:hypothetical protein